MKKAPPSPLPLRLMVFAILFGPVSWFSPSLAQEAPGQEVRRIVVLPFTTTETASPYAAGMAAVLQRSLNVIDYVYVPPVGDVLAVAERLRGLERLSPATLAEAFDATAVVSGRVEATGAEAQILIGLSGPGYLEPQELTLSGPVGDAPLLVGRVVNGVIDALALPVGAEDRSQLEGVLAQTPSFASLLAVAESSLRTQAPDLARLEAAAQLDGGSSWVMSERARALALTGDIEGARDLAQRATAAAPFDIEAWTNYGIILLPSGADALAPFEQALGLNPSHALALAGRGQLLAAADADGGTAEASLRAALAAYPRLVDAYLQLARLQAGDPQQALRTLRSGTNRVPESAVLHAAVLEAVRADGDAAALGYLRQVLGEHPESPPTVYALAARLSGEAQVAASLSLLEQGRERYPESALLAVGASVLYERQGNAEAAEAALRDALEMQPDNLDTTNRLAILQARQGRLDEARATLESVASAEPNLQVNLAQIYIQAGHSRAAVELLETLIEGSANDPQLYTLYGIALGRLGRYPQALNALDRAIVLAPGNDEVRRARAVVEQASSITEGQEVEVSPAASTAFEAGLAALEGGDPTLAAAEFAQARSAEDSGLIAFYQAYALQMSGNPRQAIAAYERALQEYPQNSVINNNLGYAYLQVGRLDRALEFINQAIALDDANARAHMNLGLTSYALSRWSEAVASWERAIALEPALESELSEVLEAARSRVN